MTYTTATIVSWGVSTDMPVPADYDGDGRIDPAVWRPSTGNWHILQSSTNYSTSAMAAWGVSTDTPPGDYDGDGRRTRRCSVLHRRVLRCDRSRSAVLASSAFWGLSTDVPCPATMTATARSIPRVSPVHRRLARVEVEHRLARRACRLWESAWTPSRPLRRRR